MGLNRFRELSGKSLFQTLSTDESAELETYLESTVLRKKQEAFALIDARLSLLGGAAKKKSMRANWTLRLAASFVAGLSLFWVFGASSFDERITLTDCSGFRHRSGQVLVFNLNGSGSNGCMIDFKDLNRSVHVAGTQLRIFIRGDEFSIQTFSERTVLSEKTVPGSVQTALYARDVRITLIGTSIVLTQENGNTDLSVTEGSVRVERSHLFSNPLLLLDQRASGELKPELVHAKVTGQVSLTPQASSVQRPESVSVTMTPAKKKPSFKIHLKSGETLVGSQFYAVEDHYTLKPNSGNDIQIPADQIIRIERVDSP